jgi:hypothetical protein
MLPELRSLYGQDAANSCEEFFGPSAFGYHPGAVEYDENLGDA